MRWRMIKQAEISPAFFIFAAFWLLVLPLRLILAAMGAAMIHELCHLLAIRMTGGEILGLRIGAGGVALETGPMTAVQEWLCAMAGPVGSLLLAVLYPWMPWVALCGLIQGVYNMLPLYPLDGGRCLRCVLELLLPVNWVSIWPWMQKGIWVVMCLAVLWLGFALDFGILPILLCGTALVRKIPCKEGKLGVQ